MKITEFKKGDEIVRIEASAGCGDRSYIGEKLIFVGIANGCVYLDRGEDNFMSKMTGTTRMDLRLDWWSDGWEYWQDIDNDTTATLPDIEIRLKEEIKKAFKDENYELVENLRKIVNDAVKNFSK